MLESKLKAPEGKYAVCDWDPSNPEKSIPKVAETLTTGKDAIFPSLKYASWYATMRNEKWFRDMKQKEESGKMVIGELEYFVMDDKGTRVT